MVSILFIILGINFILDAHAEVQLRNEIRDLRDEMYDLHDRRHEP